MAAETYPSVVTINGRPCWRFDDGTLLPVVAGGDGTEPTGDQGTGTQGTTAQGTTTTDQTQTVPTTPPAGAPGTGEPTLTLEDAQKIISDLRRENAGHRTEKQTARQERDALIDKVAQALGLKPDEAKPEQLQSTIGNLTNENKSLRGELLVWQAAAEHKVDPELTAAVLMRRGAFNNFDPADTASVDGIKNAIKDLAEKMPALRTTTTPPPPRQSGGQPPGGGAAAEPKTLHEALLAKFGGG